MMHLMGLKKYRHGYVGFVETDNRYLYFQFSRDTYKILQTYLKKDYESTDHFISVIRKFVHATFFFRRPVLMEHINQASLEKILANRKTGSADTPI